MAKREVDLMDLPGEGGVEAVPIKVGGKPFQLVGMSGPGLATWMKTVARKARRDRRGELKPEDSEFKEFHATLISLCIVDGAGNPVPKETIAEWPAITQNKLFEKCQEMNGLDDGEDDGGKGKSPHTSEGGT